MGPIALKAFQKGERGLASALHVYVGPRVCEVVQSITQQLVKSGRYAMPAHMPAPLIVFETKTMAVIARETTTAAECFVVAKDGHVRPAAGLIKREATYSCPKDDDTHLGNAIWAAVLMELMQEPRLIVQAKCRRGDTYRVVRIVGSDVVSRYVELKFTLGGTRIAGLSESQTGERAPLHYQVANWGPAQSHWPTAERRKGRDGWWSWRKAAWKGHPDYGIRLRTMAPQLPDDAPERVKQDVDAAARAAAAVTGGAQAVEAWTQEKRARHGRTVEFTKSIIAA